MASISQLTARLIDLFGSPGTADPTKLKNNLTVTPSGNVLVGSGTDNSTGKLQVTGTTQFYGAVTSSFNPTTGNWGVYRTTYDIGGAFANWNVEATRSFALQIDAPAAGSAYGGIRWTRWGGRHLAAIDAYEGGSGSTQPTIVMHVANQANAWTFNNTDILRGAGGNVWHTTNLPYPCKGDTQYNFHWSGQSGQPPWLWGGSDGTNMYVYNPSNFSVNYATSAGSVGGVSNPMPASGGWGYGGFGMSSLHVNTGGAYESNQGGQFSWNDGNGDGASWLCNNQGGGGGGWILRTVNSNNTVELGRFVITSAGAGSQGSDIRLKKDVKTIEYGLDRIRSIRGVEYTYKANDEKHYGVIAQEVKPVFPHAVIYTHAQDDDPSHHTDTDIMGVHYSDLIGPLIEAVKELADKVDAQSEEIASLKAQLGKQ